MIEAGVSVAACRACAERLGADRQLEALGIDVYHIGETFTDILKSEQTVLTV